MSQSFSRQWLHLVFATKYREPFLLDPKIRRQVHAYLAGICKNLDCEPRIIGGMPDHVHVLCDLSKNLALKDLVQNLKQESSKWIKRQWPDLAGFYWQTGYAAFSVSPNALDRVHAYIDRQEIHHRQKGFKEELILFFDQAGITYNKTYLWDDKDHREE